MFMDNKLLVLMAAKACDEKKARDIRLININKVSFISEWVLIAEGLSDVQVRSITNSVEGELRNKANIEPIRKEIGQDKLLIVDGGIRRGTDILKCLALGANAIQIGRPVIWGLSYDGQKGVELVIDILLAELLEAMTLTGCRNLTEITRDLVREV